MLLIGRLEEFSTTVRALDHSIVPIIDIGLIIECFYVLKGPISLIVYHF